jgi:hypothetical protein
VLPLRIFDSWPARSHSPQGQCQWVATARPMAASKLPSMYVLRTHRDEAAGSLCAGACTPLQRARPGTAVTLRHAEYTVHK